jgi:hypothetical protein
MFVNRAPSNSTGVLFLRDKLGVNQVREIAVFSLLFTASAMDALVSK